VPVDTHKGEQHLPAYEAINANAKCPALVDADVTIFSRASAAADGRRLWAMGLCCARSDGLSQDLRVRWSPSVHKAEFAIEPIYYVMAWACHRRCKHCYEDRFRPYLRKELAGVVEEAQRNFPRIIDNFPRRMSYVDPAEGPGQHSEKIGRIVLSGGESLLDAVRETVTYPVIERLQQRYANEGGVKIVVQTTGDLLTDSIVDELLQRGVYMISVASVDDFHVGLEGPDKQQAFVDKLSAMFDRHDMRRSGLSATTCNWHEEEGPLYGF